MEDCKIREAQVAGQFYSSTATKLKKEIELLLDNQRPEKKEAIGCMMPHAGYMYSGKVAATVAASVKIKDTVILLGPNHTGYGKEFGLMAEGAWQTPLGNVPVNQELARALLKNSQFLEEDDLAHAYEHSLEVELPFLQYFKNSFSIVPLVFSSKDLATYKKIGGEIAQTIKELNLTSSILVIASSDMTHYETQESAQKKDKEAISAILELDEDRLWERIQKFNISMCGYAPTIAMLSAAKLLGAKNAKLLDYQTSGDVTGDYSSVVGYAGVIIF